MRKASSYVRHITDVLNVRRRLLNSMVSILYAITAISSLVYIFYKPVNGKPFNSDDLFLGLFLGAAVLMVLFLIKRSMIWCLELFYVKTLFQEFLEENARVNNLPSSPSLREIQHRKYAYFRSVSLLFTEYPLFSWLFVLLCLSGIYAVVPFIFILFVLSWRYLGVSAHGDLEERLLKDASTQSFLLELIKIRNQRDFNEWVLETMNSGNEAKISFTGME